MRSEMVAGGTVPKRADDLLGTSVGSYRIERLIGIGGMGRVYQATHPTIGTRVAIKVLSPEFAENAGVVQRFLREARASAALEHPNIAEIYDFDRLPDGRPCMIFEFLEGESLKRKLMREGRLAPAKAIEILRQVCGAVGEAHRRGIVHRDLKPDNIYLVHRRGAEGLVKVLDFGIAKIVDDEQAGGDATRVGMVLGTPEYMSPEQALGENHRVGTASDIYSLGIIAYHMFAGRVPFSGEGLSITRLAMLHATAPPPPLRLACPDLPHPAERVVLKALAKEPADRWPSAEELADALARSLDPAQGTEVERLLFEDTVTVPAGGVPDEAPTIVVPDGASASVSAFAGADEHVNVHAFPASQIRVHGARWRVVLLAGAGGAIVVGVVAMAGRRGTPAAPTVATHVIAAPQAVSPEPPVASVAARTRSPLPPAAPAVARTFSPVPLAAATPEARAQTLPPRARPVSEAAVATPAPPEKPSDRAVKPTTKPATATSGSAIDTSQDGLGF